MHQIILESQAEKFLKNLDKHEQTRVISKLKELADNPELGKPLTANLAGLRSLRMGNYRALYEIRNQELVILVLKLGHRKDIYKN